MIGITDLTGDVSAVGYQLVDVHRIADTPVPPLQEGTTEMRRETDVQRSLARPEVLVKASPHIAHRRVNVAHVHGVVSFPDALRDAV